MASKKLAAVVLSMGCFGATTAYSLGLGDLTIESYLNEPLNASVDLLNLGGLHEDQIRIKLATTEDFDRLGVDRAYFLTSLKFAVSVDDSGRGTVVITSQDPVLEPYLDFIVEARWPSGRLLREYTILVDPPAFDQSTPVVSASQRVAETEGSPDPRAKKSAEPEVTQGTRVDVRKSELEPGQMPERDYWAETSGTPVAGSRYMIRRDETLWEIAAKAAPEGISVQQAMLDIQRLNPEAFLDGNINRIKAGYIVYLPDAGDISASDQAAAIEEVRQQNQEWREGRSSLERRGLARPSLRISADTEAEAEVADEGEVGSTATTGSAVDREEADRESLAQLELDERVAALEQQLETLERIVTLKDEQIAALQDALADAAQQPIAAPEPELPADLEVAPAEEASPTEGSAPGPDAQPVVQTPAPQPAPAVESEQGGGLLRSVVYGLVALAVALIGLLLWRRRSGAEQEPAPAPVPVRQQSREDVFANVELKEPQLDLRVNGNGAHDADITRIAPAAEEPGAEVAGEGDRGYGQRRHDQYASDMDAGDALAEADIYIAYGRYPQAMDLLRTAIANEPENPAYHLKLLRIASETGDREEAERQHNALRAIGDRASLEEAETLLGIGAAESSPLGDLGDGREELAGGGEVLETDFSGLDLEPQGGLTEEESLVIAAEGNEMSTKLDLARAYLDMGDVDGARQILEEVIAEGSEEQGQEARSLLDRIG